MEFLFRDRAAGKRQVKPSQDIALLEDQLAVEESSDDSEYKIEGDPNRGQESDNSRASDDSDSNSGSGSSDEDDDEDKKSEKNELEALKTELNSTELLHLASHSLQGLKNVDFSKSDKDVKICGCCLGKSSSDANEIVECDGCGVSVHEGCYGITESGSVASTVSEASTEPWFCEPCRASLDRPPACELCPNVGGIYKETDVGRWVHLICALYTPGVAFGDQDRLTHVTLFELNYKNWGHRTCVLCPETRMSKTGVCIQCDAGMCKSYFHVTCAQQHGLLMEPSYNELDSYLGHCKAHTDKEVIRSRKSAYLTQLVAAVKRRAAIDGRNSEEPKVELGEKRDLANETPGQRILRKLGRQQVKYKGDRSQLEAWVPTKRIPRLLSTSASAVRKIQRMGEIMGVSLERQLLEEKHQLTVAESRKKWYIPPALSVEYVSYYFDRGNRLDDLKKNLDEQTKKMSDLRSEENRLRPKYELLSRNTKIADENESLRKRTSTFRDTLAALFPSRTLPSCEALKPLLVLPEVAYMTFPGKNGTASGGGGPSTSSSNHLVNNNHSSHPQQSHTSDPCRSSAASSLTHTCSSCQRTKDQHLMAHCDECRKHYHIGCLNPPLTRMPKITKQYGWRCSNCDKISSDSDKEMAPEELEAPRKKRMAAAKADLSRNVSRRGSHDAWQDASHLLNSNSPAKPTSSSNHKQPVVSLVNGNYNSTEFLNSEKTSTSSQHQQHHQPVPSLSHPPPLPSNDVDEAKRRDLIAAVASIKTSGGGGGHSDEERQKRKKKKKEKKKKREKRERELKEKLKDDDDEDEEEEDEESPNEMEIIEVGDRCEVRIKPKPLKLKVKPVIKPQSIPSTTAGAPTWKNGTNNHVSNSIPPANGTSEGVVNVYDFEDDNNGVEENNVNEEPEKITSRKRKRSSLKDKDVRTGCDKCGSTGENSNLVRCDECKKCYHFGCLDPPVKKSPKVAGFSWHCDQCDHSVDTDWHLD